MTKAHLSNIGTMTGSVYIQRDVDGDLDDRLGPVLLRVLDVDFLLAGGLLVIAREVLGHAVGEGLRKVGQTTLLDRLEEL